MMTLPAGLKVGLVQRVFPSYRSEFFELLGQHCRLSFFSGKPRPSENINLINDLQNGQYTPGKNIHLFRGKFYLCYQRGLMRWLKQFDPGVLILEANPRYLSSYNAIHWMHQHGKAVIGWGLGAPVKESALALVRQWFFDQFDALITYSKQGAAQLEALGVKKESVFVAVNATTAKPTHALPERPSFFQGKPVVLFVGRLQARKRIDQLILACQALPKNLQPDLLIVGDGPERAKLESIAQNNYPTTQFLGAKYGDELADIFRQADLFVLPGTGGLAIQQAMSYGLPVIAAEADGTQANLVQPGNGWQITPGDQIELNKVLMTALSDPNKLRQMGQRSYDIVSSEVNIETMVQVFLQAIAYAKHKDKGD